MDGMYFFIIAKITKAMKDKNMNMLSEKLGKSKQYIGDKIKALDILYIEDIFNILGKTFCIIIKDKFDFTDEEFDKSFDNAKSEMLLQFVLPDK
jgi:hypothetical protein